MRHATAMHMLQTGTDITTLSVISIIDSGVFTIIDFSTFGK